MIYLALVLLILGMVFTIAEMLAPGFGVFGITGIVMFIASWVITIIYMEYGLIIVISEIVLLIGAGCAFFRFLKTKNLKGTIILDESVGEDKKENYQSLIGKEGISKTPLKPFGKAEFSGELIDVCAESFVESNKKVVAVKFYDGKLYVKTL